jgi:hypothetical protein
MVRNRLVVKWLDFDKFNLKKKKLKNNDEVVFFF